MNRLEKRVAVLLLSTALSVGSAGCSSTVIKGKRLPQKDYSTYNEEVLSYTGITITPAKNSGDTSNAENMISYLDFLDKYESYTKGIIQSLQDKKFDDVENQVKGLAGLLEHDSSPYADKMLNRVKEFSYIKYEYLGPEYKETKRMTINPMKWLGTAVVEGVFVAFSPIAILTMNGGYFKDAYKTGKDCLTASDKQKISKGYYRKVLVKPYYSIEEIIEDGGKKNR